MTGPVIALQGAGYRTREGRWLLRDASLALWAGRVHAVVGPNGAGKSTLLRLASGELRPCAGAVLLDGRPLRDSPAPLLAARRAVLAQAASLAFPFTAGEVARLGAEGVGRGLRPADRRRIAADALERADVAHLAERPVQELSGGERQRVHLARVLAQLEAGSSLGEPQALLLDEPVAALDLRHALALLALAREIAARGTAVMAVLHDLQLAAAFADEVTLVEGGRVSAQGTPREVLTPQRIEAAFGVALAGPDLPPMPWRRERPAGSPPGPG